MENIKWHTVSIREVEEKLSTSFEKGLSRDEARRRLEKYGPNELVQIDHNSVFSMLLYQFKDFIVIVLIVAAIISGILGELTDSIIIMLIVILNAILGVVQEYKAEQSLEA